MLSSNTPRNWVYFCSSPSCSSRMVSSTGIRQQARLVARLHQRGSWCCNRVAHSPNQLPSTQQKLINTLSVSVHHSSSSSGHAICILQGTSSRPVCFSLLQFTPGFFTFAFVAERCMYNCIQQLNSEGGKSTRQAYG